MKTKKEILKEFEEKHNILIAEDGFVEHFMGGISITKINSQVKFLSQALDQAEQNVINKIKEMEKGDEPIVSASAMIVLEELKEKYQK